MNELQTFSKRLIEHDALLSPPLVPDLLLRLVTEGWDDDLDLAANLRQAERWLTHYPKLAIRANDQAD